MPGLADSCLASLVGRQLQGSAPAGLVSLQESLRSRRRRSGHTLCLSPTTKSELTVAAAEGARTALVYRLGILSNLALVVLPRRQDT